MRSTSRVLLCFWLVLCLAATGAGQRHGQGSRTPHPARVFSLRPGLTHSPATLCPSKIALTPAAKPLPPTAATLYPQSLRADERYSYRGRQVSTYWRTGRTEAVIVSHRAPNLRRIDYLAPDDERGRSVVTNGSEQWQYDPRGHRLSRRLLGRDAHMVADAAQGYDLLRSNYVLEVEPQPRMQADRKVFILAMTRKPSHQLARKLWIDAATGLVLKREYFREDGKLGLTIAFTDINFHAPLAPRLFDLSDITKRAGVKTISGLASSETSMPLLGVRSQLNGAALAPASLNGYRLVSAALTKSGAATVLHLRYSDGLNLLSLFEQRRTQARHPTRVPATMRKTRIGRRDGYVQRQSSLTVLNWDTEALNLTLMGDLAESSLKRLAVAADLGGAR